MINIMLAKLDKQQDRNSSKVYSSIKYLEANKFCDTLNLAILYLTKLTHTKFSDSINLSIDVA